MVKLPARCERAAWKPVPNFGYSPARTNDAAAFVVHSAEGYGDPPPRFYDGASASAHFWNRKDGVLYQLVELTRCAWANGQLNRLDSGADAPAIVKSWYRTRTNPNYVTISMEHEGVAGEPLTAGQLANTVNVARWLETHGLALSPNNLLQHCDISATACPSGRIPVQQVLNTIHSTATKQEGTVTATEFEDLLLAIFSGHEERTLTREQRVVNARYRVAQRTTGAPDGTYLQSVGCDAGAALNLAMAGAKAAGVPPETVQSIVRKAIDQVLTAAQAANG